MKCLHVLYICLCKAQEFVPGRNVGSDWVISPSDANDVPLLSLVPLLGQISELCTISLIQGTS